MMKIIKIHSYKDNSLLYEGQFENTSACIEDAVKEGANLAYADFRNLNLSNINLDDARMPFADFSSSNLTGANMSESFLNGVIFRDSSLYNTCFAYSDMQACDFKGASFGGTNILGCNISFSSFSTLSCFDLDFTHARTMKECVFMGHKDERTTLSRPPIVVKGISKKPIVITKDRMLHGHQGHEFSRLFMHLNKFLSSGSVLSEISN